MLNSVLVSDIVEALTEDATDMESQSVGCLGGAEWPLPAHLGGEAAQFVGHLPGHELLVETANTCWHVVFVP